MTPKEGQSKEDFINEYMKDKEMISKYPNEKERMKMCLECWDEENEDEEMEMAKNQIVYKNGDKWVLDQSIDISLDKATDQVKPTEKDQWIKVLPKGEHFIEKYNRKINFDDTMFANIKTAFSAVSLSKPFIDKNHERKESYGWVKELKAKEDGLFAKVKLNKVGVELVKDENYKYVSPYCTPVKDTNGQTYPYKLRTISLTNEPALEAALPELQSQISLDKGGDMNLDLLISELALSKDSSIESIVDEIKKLKESKIEAENKAIELSKEIQSHKTETMKVEAKEFAKKQIELGKMHPAISEIVIDRYILDKESVIKEYDLIPEKITAKERKLDNSIEMSKEEEAIAVKAGYDLTKPDDYKEAMKFIKNAKTRIGGK